MRDGLFASLTLAGYLYQRQHAEALYINRGISVALTVECNSQGYLHSYLNPSSSNKGKLLCEGRWQLATKHSAYEGVGEVRGRGMGWGKGKVRGKRGGGGGMEGGEEGTGGREQKIEEI